MNQEVCFKGFKCLNVTQELEAPGLAGLMSEVNAADRCGCVLDLVTCDFDVFFLYLERTSDLLWVRTTGDMKD